MAAVSLFSYMGGASLIILRLLRIVYYLEGSRIRLLPPMNEECMRVIERFTGIFARIPVNIRVAAAADNANNLRSSHITKRVYSLYDIATELHEKNTL